MSTSVGNIIDQLAIIIDTVAAIKTIYKYLPRTPDTNVTASIYYDSARFEPAEVNSHWAFYKFEIIIYIPMHNEKTMQADQVTYGDSVMDALRAKPSLSDTCQGYTIDELKNDYVKAANGNIYGIVLIAITVRKEEDL
jgi:hypothetical protein